MHHCRVAKICWIKLMDSQKSSISTLYGDKSTVKSNTFLIPILGFIIFLLLSSEFL